MRVVFERLERRRVLSAAAEAVTFDPGEPYTFAEYEWAVANPEGTVTRADGTTTPAATVLAEVHDEGEEAAPRPDEPASFEITGTLRHFEVHEYAFDPDTGVNTLTDADGVVTKLRFAPAGFGERTTWEVLQDGSYTVHERWYVEVTPPADVMTGWPAVFAEPGTPGATVIYLVQPKTEPLAPAGTAVDGGWSVPAGEAAGYDPTIAESAAPLSVVPRVGGDRDPTAEGMMGNTVTYFDPVEDRWVDTELPVLPGAHETAVLQRLHFAHADDLTAANADAAAPSTGTIRGGLMKWLYMSPFKGAETGYTPIVAAGDPLPASDGYWAMQAVDDRVFLVGDAASGTYELIYDASTGLDTWHHLTHAEAGTTPYDPATDFRDDGLTFPGAVRPWHVPQGTASRGEAPAGDRASFMLYAGRANELADEGYASARGVPDDQQHVHVQGALAAGLYNMPYEHDNRASIMVVAADSPLPAESSNYRADVAADGTVRLVGSMAEEGVYVLGYDADLGYDAWTRVTHAEAGVEPFWSDTLEVDGTTWTRGSTEAITITWSDGETELVTVADPTDDNAIVYRITRDDAPVTATPTIAVTRGTVLAPAAFADARDLRADPRPRVYGPYIDGPQSRDDDERDDVLA